MFEKKCCNGGNKHKFRPRYDESPSGFKFTEIERCSPSDLRKLLVRNIYVRDVCVWCGKTIEKDKH